MADWVNLNSSNLKSAKYDTDTEYLKIKFKSGSIYRYSKVPEDIYNALIDSDQSSGKYFTKNIRDSFQFTKIKGPSS